MNEINETSGWPATDTVGTRCATAPAFVSRAAGSTQSRQLYAVCSAEPAAEETNAGEWSRPVWRYWFGAGTILVHESCRRLGMHARCTLFDSDSPRHACTVAAAPVRTPPEVDTHARSGNPHAFTSQSSRVQHARSARGLRRSQRYDPSRAWPYTSVFANLASLFYAHAAGASPAPGRR